MPSSFDLLNLQRSGNLAIEKLFSKAHSHAWNLEKDVNWKERIRADDPIMAPGWAPCSRTATFALLPERARTHFTRRALGWNVHSLMLGEAVAQEVCVRIATHSRLDDHRAHAVAQAMDEARHRMAYGRLLDRFGDEPEELDRNTRAMFDVVLQVQDVADLVAWEQFYLESVAMNVLRSIKSGARHALVKDVFSLNLRDESRHMGFGILFLQDHLETLSLDEQIDFARFWMDRILPMNFGAQDPVPLPRAARWLYEADVKDSLTLATQMLLEQQAISAAEWARVAQGKHVPQELKSARRIGLMRPEILEALNLSTHPLILGTLKSDAGAEE